LALNVIVFEPFLSTAGYVITTDVDVLAAP
jgi:hypothetical protein